jgi:hypothetical protein
MGEFNASGRAGLFAQRLRGLNSGAETYENGYNLRMHLAILAMRVVEAMFFVGLAGSAIVVFISFIEDAKELAGEE